MMSTVATLNKKSILLMRVNKGLYTSYNILMHIAEAILDPLYKTKPIAS